MVWAKLKGFPWWPGMIDYCPDSQARNFLEIRHAKCKVLQYMLIKTQFQEYYWIDEDISVTEPTYYNVVYFEGRGDEVSYFDKFWKS